MTSWFDKSVDRPLNRELRAYGFKSRSSHAEFFQAFFSNCFSCLHITARVFHAFKFLSSVHIFDISHIVHISSHCLLIGMIESSVDSKMINGVVFNIRSLQVLPKHVFILDDHDSL